MREEYDFSNGVRGKYLNKYKEANMAVKKKLEVPESEEFVDLNELAEQENERKESVDELFDELRKLDDNLMGLYAILDTLDLIKAGVERKLEETNDILQELFNKSRSIRDVNDRYNPTKK